MRQRSCGPSRSTSVTACCRTAFPTAAKRRNTTPSTRRCGTSTRSAPTSKPAATTACSATCSRCCSDIIDWHVAGTRYGIGVDEQDGLLRAGEAGVQLTWMDAKVGDWVVTPRIGKPVEINALWYNALARMSGLGEAAARSCQWPDLRRDGRARRRFVRERVLVRGRAATCTTWSTGRTATCCRAGGASTSRPAEPDLRRRAGQRAARARRRHARSSTCCARHLLTPIGLRSLRPSDPGYVARYQAGPGERDGAYHQGTVWSWLLGPVRDRAPARVRRHRPARSRSWRRLPRTCGDACVGSISEIFDADAAACAARLLRPGLERGGSAACLRLELDAQARRTDRT